MELIGREIQMLRELSHTHPHRNIVAYFGSFYVRRNLWIVMELCDGGSLADLVGYSNSILSGKVWPRHLAEAWMGVGLLFRQVRIGSLHSFALLRFALQRTVSGTSRARSSRVSRTCIQFGRCIATSSAETSSSPAPGRSNSQVHCSSPAPLYREPRH